MTRSLHKLRKDLKVIFKWSCGLFIEYVMTISTLVVLCYLSFASHRPIIRFSSITTTHKVNKIRMSFSVTKNPYYHRIFTIFLILVPIYFTFYTIIHKHDHVSISRCTIPQYFLCLNRQNKIIIEFVSSSFLCITIKFHCVHRVM